MRLQEMFKAGTIQRKRRVRHHEALEQQSSSGAGQTRLRGELCRRLQLDDVDCYLIHVLPLPSGRATIRTRRDERGQVIYDSGVTLGETWRALESLVDEGRCRSIGLSNVNLAKLKEIVEGARIKPAVVEVESHPYLPEWELLDYCRRQEIVLLAFAALGHGMEPRLLDDPVIVAIAQRLGKTPAQVVLAWAIQRGTALLTTSVTPRRIQENFDLSAIPDDAMQEIRDRVATTIRFNAVVETGVPGFIPGGRR